jgi:hypothetical protein
MDPVSLGFYAAVCGALTAAGPWMGGLLARFGIGVIVGLIASLLLPAVQGIVGY